MSDPLWMNEEWKADSLKWRGAVLKGRFAHWCNEWDGLPVDETTEEFLCCGCGWGDETVAAKAAQDSLRAQRFLAQPVTLTDALTIEHTTIGDLLLGSVATAPKAPSTPPPDARVKELEGALRAIVDSPLYGDLTFEKRGKYRPLFDKARRSLLGASDPAEGK